MDFTGKLRLRGQAEEDLYFAELDRQLIKAMREKQKHEEDILNPKILTIRI
ncbi:hypothetical protein P4S72_25130 [Vibrio sp. PP-XX7]